MFQDGVTTPDMGRGRPKSQFELLTEIAGFRVTPEQLEWLRVASVAAGEMSLSEWIRKLTVTAGEKLVDNPFPRRKLLPTTKKKKTLDSPRLESDFFIAVARAA